MYYLPPNQCLCLSWIIYVITVTMETYYNNINIILYGVMHLSHPNMRLILGSLPTGRKPCLVIIN
jgi:hypothetical protein